MKMLVASRANKDIMVAIFTIVMTAMAVDRAAAAVAGHVPTTTGGSSVTLTHLENNNIVDFFNSFSTKNTHFEEQHRRSLLLPYVEGTGGQHHNEDDINAFLGTLNVQHDDHAAASAARLGYSNNNNKTVDGKVEVEQFVRSLQQQSNQQKKRTANIGSGGFATRGSYLDVKLRGSGLFDNGEGSSSTKSNYNDMAVPRSYGGRSGPDETKKGTTEESLTRSYGSDGGSKKTKRSKKGGPKGKEHGKREKGTSCSLIRFLDRCPIEVRRSPSVRLLCCLSQPERKQIRFNVSLTTHGIN